MGDEKQCVASVAYHIIEIRRAPLFCVANNHNPYRAPIVSRADKYDMDMSGRRTLSYIIFFHTYHSPACDNRPSQNGCPEPDHAPQSPQSSYEVRKSPVVHGVLHVKCERILFLSLSSFGSTIRCMDHGGCSVVASIRPPTRPVRHWFLFIAFLCQGCGSFQPTEFRHNAAFHSWTAILHLGNIFVSDGAVSEIDDSHMVLAMIIHRSGDLPGASTDWIWIWIWSLEDAD